MSDVSQDPIGAAGSYGIEPNKDARNWATLCHLGGLGIYLIPGIGHILGPLVIWLLKKDQYPFVDDQGKEALNFQISMTLYLLVSGISILACVGFVLFPAVLLADLVLMIIAATKTSKGEAYRYPLTIRLIQ
jgi:uncharacterized Tic20 family protein